METLFFSGDPTDAAIIVTGLYMKEKVVGDTGALPVWNG